MVRGNRTEVRKAVRGSIESSVSREGEPRAREVSRLLLSAVLPSLFLTTTVYLTTSRSGEALVVLVLHYPVFLLASAMAIHAVPRKWWIAANVVFVPAILAELLIIG